LYYSLLRVFIAVNPVKICTVGYFYMSDWITAFFSLAATVY